MKTFIIATHGSFIGAFLRPLILTSAHLLAYYRDLQDAVPFSSDLIHFGLPWLSTHGVFYITIISFKHRRNKCVLVEEDSTL